MNKEFYEKYYKSGILTYCEAIDSGYIGFILQDIPQNDDDTREISDLPTRVIAYIPRVIIK